MDSSDPKEMKVGGGVVESRHARSLVQARTREQRRSHTLRLFLNLKTKERFKIGGKIGKTKDVTKIV